MNLRIVIAAHKPYPMPSGDAYLPLLVGAALRRREDTPPYQRDDEGESISARNANWCELTGLYWAWRNLKAEAIGLVHYRRHFKAAPERIAALLERHDIILPRKRITSSRRTTRSTRTRTMRSIST